METNTVKEFKDLESQDFYETLYTYRCAPVFNQELVVEKFDAVKDWVKEYSKEHNKQLLEALQESTELLDWIHENIDVPESLREHFYNQVTNIQVKNVTAISSALGEQTKIS